MNSQHGFDKLLLIAAFALMVLGALMVYSTTSVITPGMESRHITDELFYLKKHLFTMALGFVAMYAAYKVRRETLPALALPLLCVAFVLLLLVFVPGIGVTAGGARRWLRLWPSTFQPSELVKCAMVIFLAWLLSREWFSIEQPGHFAVPVGAMVIFQGVFLLQPDFGAAMSLGVLTVSMLFVAGARRAHMGALLLMTVPGVLWLLRTPYRMKRLLSFLDPWENRHEGAFQLMQSYIALDAGGFSGVGLGESRQKLDFLPEVHTDFIFSVVGEEMGFLAAVFVVGLFAFVFYRGLAIAARARDPFGQYAAFGLSLMVALQSIVNICVITGLLPTKGLPLPFISYGGSALFINMAAVGLLLNYSRPQGDPEVDGRLDELTMRISRKKARRAVYGTPL
jgi:cell division protein FtsW